jgi:hypothetical protein
MAIDVTPAAGPTDSRLRWSVVLSVVAAVVTLFAVAVAAGKQIQAHANEPPVYSTTREMAEAIGCTDSYVDTVSAGPTSAGECTVNGERVVLRTFQNINEAMVWHDGVVWASEERPLGGIGSNYVVQTHDPETMNAVSAALG